MELEHLEPGYYYAIRHKQWGSLETEETVIYVCKGEKANYILDARTLLVGAYRYEILGPVPTVRELESLSEVTA